MIVMCFIRLTTGLTNLLTGQSTCYFVQVSDCHRSPCGAVQREPDQGSFRNPETFGLHPDAVGHDFHGAKFERISYKFPARAKVWIKTSSERVIRYLYQRHLRIVAISVTRFANI